MTNLIRLPQLPWEGSKELELPLPDSWEVEVCNIAGYDRPAMTDEQIRASITNLIGSPAIREMARGKNEVAIIFDDMTRITRVAKIVPFVLEELAEAGIPDSNIRFVVALGSHAPLERPDLVKKLGETVVSRFPVYNHNPFDYCTYVGTTSRGTRVNINSEVMRCDFKIVIGLVVPHRAVIYSGGGKKIVPGVASVETIIANHRLPRSAEFETNEMRLDIEEAAQLVGVDVLVECVVNLWGDSVAIFAGAEVPAHAAGVQEAKVNNLAPRAEDKDIVIANIYAKANEATTGFKVAGSVSKKGGDLIIIANTPRGQVNHYLMGWWGKNTGGELKPKAKILPHINRVIYYTEYPNKTDLEWIEESPKVVLMSNWDDVLKTLQEAHGDTAKVAVYPNADILYFA